MRWNLYIVWLAGVLLFLVLIIGLPSRGQAISPNPGQGYSRTLTVNSGQSPSNLADFPLLVSISADRDLQAHVARADGGDIIFTDSSNTTRYASEIEKYDKTNGTLVAWVKAPSLSDGTIIKMWYGIDNGRPPEEPPKVWDPHFKMVQHMNLTADNRIEDSSANANNGTFQGKSAITPAAGIIGEAVTLPGAAYIDCGSSSSLDFKAQGNYTWDMWIKPTAFQPGGSGILGKKHSPNVDRQGFELYAAGIGGAGGGGFSGGFAGGKDASQLRFQTTGGNSNSVSSSDTGLSSGVWVHLVVVYNTSQKISIYMNGDPIQVVSQPGEAVAGFGSVTTSDDAQGAAYQDPFFIGWRRSAPAGADRGFFFGQIDEIEVSDTIRSADWIKTEYNNRQSPGTFYSLSAELNENSGAPTQAEMDSQFISIDGTADLSNLIDISSQQIKRNIKIGSADENAVLNIQGLTSIDPAVHQITCRPVSRDVNAQPDKSLVSSYEFEPGNTTFTPPATLTLKFDPEAIPSGFAISDLSLAHWDETTRTWQKMTGSSINAIDHTISTGTAKLGRFGILVEAAPVTATTPAAAQGGLNWMLIGINIAIVIAALAFVFLRFGKKRGNSSQNKPGPG